MADPTVLEKIERDVAATQARILDYKMVTFTLAGKDYGIDIMSVKEIAKFRFSVLRSSQLILVRK